jgi:2-haloacid dehalogenase
MPRMLRYDAVLFDLLTALLDSWSLWNEVAGDEARGLEWRKAFLRRAYATGSYAPYDEVVIGSAKDAGMPVAMAKELLRRWDELQPWPDVPEVLGALAAAVPLGVVTNCSEALGERAVARIPVRFTVVVTAERAGFYKPDLRIYRRGLAELGTAPERTLFVAGSAGDVPGATAAGMPVYWHNRVGMELPKGAAPPRIMAPTLGKLQAEVLGA